LNPYIEMKMTKSAGKTALKPKTTVKSKTSTTSAAPAPVAPPPPPPTPVAAAVPAPIVAAPKPTPAPAPKAPGAETSPSPAITTIDVKFDVGFGNSVFVRGQGSGLTWDHGVPLVCVDAKTWRWSGEAKDPIKFKVLINDSIWSAGNDITVIPGQKVEVAPEFA
jgi:hypothetical protein